MAWANSSNIDTTNLDSGTDSPAAARADLKAALDELVLVIDGRGQVNGVAPLNASTKVAATYLPDELNSSSGSNLTLDPDTGKVAIEEILNLAPQTAAQLKAMPQMAILRFVQMVVKTVLALAVLLFMMARIGVQCN